MLCVYGVHEGEGGLCAMRWTSRSRAALTPDELAPSTIRSGASSRWPGQRLRYLSPSLPAWGATVGKPSVPIPAAPAA